MKKLLPIMMIMLFAIQAQALEWYVCCKYVTRNDPTADFKLQDDGAGVFIKEWNSTVAKPTQAALQAVEATAIAWFDDKTKTDNSDYDKWSVQEKAMLKLLVKEINTLRALHGLAPRTKEQVITALKAEM